MLSTSFEFRSKIAENTKALFKATLTLADGTVRELTGDDVMMGTAAFSDSVSSSGSFDVGAAIMNQFTVTLNNYDRRFDEYDFTGATIVPYVGVELDETDPETGEQLIEWLLKGHYWVEQPESYGNTIGVSALDNMTMLEVPYSGVGTRYPASLRTIAADICEACGVALLDPDFVNCSYVVATRPDDGALSCRDMIGYIAQVSGNFARFDAQGRLVIDWYAMSAFESEDWLDGESFDDDSPYSSGSVADGGNFIDYTSGDEVEGGSFDSNAIAYVHAVSSLTVVTDDVVVTGIRVTAQDEVLEDGSSGNDGETALSGNEGYVLDIADNPLVLYGQATAVAALIAPRVVGMRFRPFDVSAIGNPAIEAGDPIIITDRLQNQYRSYVTSTTYKMGGYQAIACGAETPGRNTATSYSALTKAVVKARNAVRRERKAREIAQQVLQQQLAGASGFYTTNEVLDDGSLVSYMHDQPTLAASTVVWKATANAFGVSNDGGATYSYGVDNNGVAILNQIYAVGIDADYLNTGALSVRNADGTEVFRADVETGTVMVNTPNFTLTPQGVITARSGTIGGFTIGSTSLYNGPDNLDSTTRGVYVGTDGMETSDGYNRLVVSNGAIVGKQGQADSGSIEPTATVNMVDPDTGEPTGEVLRGLQILGGILDFRVDKLAVIDRNSKTPTSRVAVTKGDIHIQHAKRAEFTGSRGLFEVRFQDIALDLVHGMVVREDEVNYDPVHLVTDTYLANNLVDKEVEIKNWTSGEIDGVVRYVNTELGGKADSSHTHNISDVSGLQTALNGKASTGHTHSGYASSTHTHSYSSLTGKPSIPKFSLSGTTLTITT